MPDEYLLKICLIGTPDDLKTDMIRIFAEGKFITDYLFTHGVDITTKQIQVAGNNIKLIIADTAGQEFFGRLRPSYYRGASAAIMTFAKYDRASFNAVREFHKEFKQHIPESSVPIALVGFITESETVTTEEGQNLAKELGVSYYESNLTDRKTIETIFHDLAIKVLRKKGDI